MGNTLPLSAERGGTFPCVQCVISAVWRYLGDIPMSKCQPKKQGQQGPATPCEGHRRQGKSKETKALGSSGLGKRKRLPDASLDAGCFTIQKAYQVWEHIPTGDEQGTMARERGGGMCVNKEGFLTLAVIKHYNRTLQRLSYLPPHRILRIRQTPLGKNGLAKTSLEAGGCSR